MPLTEAERAYAAAYQTALVEDDLSLEDDAPSADAFGVSAEKVEMIQTRVKKGTVDYSDMPAMLRPPELETE